jgi:hypothetical protein
MRVWTVAGALSQRNKASEEATQEPGAKGGQITERQEYRSGEQNSGNPKVKRRAAGGRGEGDEGNPAGAVGLAPKARHVSEKDQGNEETGKGNQPLRGREDAWEAGDKAGKNDRARAPPAQSPGCPAIPGAQMGEREAGQAPGTPDGAGRGALPQAREQGTRHLPDPRENANSERGWGQGQRRLRENERHTGGFPAGPRGLRRLDNLP